MFIQRNEKRSELQQRIAAELHEKARARQEADPERPDGVDDSSYLQSTKKTTSLAGIWVAIVVVALAILVFFIVRTT